MEPLDDELLELLPDDEPLLLLDELDDELPFDGLLFDAGFPVYNCLREWMLSWDLLLV